MHALRLLALALALAAPSAAWAAGGNVVQSGAAPFGLDAPHAPQAYCIVAQLTSAPARCDAFDLPMRGAHLLRLRIEGEGHAIAWADYHHPSQGLQQIPHNAPFDCRAQPQAPSTADLLQGRVKPPLYAMCSHVFDLSNTGLTGKVNLHVLADGPGRASYSLWVERIVASLP